ncbi:hypothetical protein BIV57_22715 [Mangrovactinospora gilvigrisea]|uniref:FAD-binding FR-type domain-containing protein n=1 Tax=Mangrovactinospora gilvigrisea TaxID=1428644 RepID=A0A1J7B9F3_9ACTN|nr:siderophore-interacting protein [Mangrovactinospora gilvigrisea]OIV35229.1 hypothetical protein BIV57_22715 [Mangrovactinospora gilvigrisea]
MAMPFVFFPVRVAGTRAVGRSTVRITFVTAVATAESGTGTGARAWTGARAAGGCGLDALASGGRDQRVKLFLPHPHQAEPVLPLDSGENWYPDWRAADPAERAVMRSYTIREHRPGPDGGEVDIDFVLHGHEDGSGGPATTWAARAAEGDRAVLLGPVEEDNGGVDFRPPPDTSAVLLAGDETALPALEGILAALEPGRTARVVVRVPSADDIRDLPTRADAEVVWLVGDGRALVDAVREGAVPSEPEDAYAWVAGEAAAVREVRRHLVRERGMPRRRVTFTGYWRRGASEEQLLEEAVAAAASD